MKIRDAFKIVQQMGLPWTVFRATYELKKKTGILKTTFPQTQYKDDEFIEKCLNPHSKSESTLFELVYSKTEKSSIHKKVLA